MLEPAILLDYQHLTQRAGAVWLPQQTWLEFTGSDAAKFLQNFCTNDVLRLAAGETCEAFVCNVKGHTLGHVQIHRAENSLWINTVPRQAALLLAHWDRYLIREQVVMHDRSAEYELFAVVGPQAADHVSSCRNLPGAWLFPANFPHTGAYLFASPIGAAEKVRDHFTHANLPLCAAAALEILRVEQGYPLFGVDLTADNLPQEIDRNAEAISFKKGCYLGQETVARIDALGHVNQQLRRVLLDSPLLPQTELTAGGKGVGKITSSVWSVQYQQPLALAMLRRGWEAPGTKLDAGKVFP
jgi:tRNA-modifying protein YgfZ